MKKLSVVRVICLFALAVSSTARASVSGVPAANVTFNTSFYQPNSTSTAPALYIGAKTVDPAATDAEKAAALTRATLQQNFGSASTIKFDSLASQKTVSLNTQPANDSPFFNKPITNISMAGTLPVVTIDEQKIYVVTQPSDGSMVVTNDDGAGVNTQIKINDNQGNTHPAKQVVAVTGATDASSNPMVFAAVSSETENWESGAAGADNRGIALLKPILTGNFGLTVYDATDFTKKDAGNKSVKLKLVATKNDVAIADRGPIAFKAADAAKLAGALGQIDTAEFGPGADLLWHNDLQRLYIGMNAVRRDDRTLEGGVFGLAMGRIDGNELKLQPILDDAKRELLYDAGDATKTNRSDQIVGFYYDGFKAKGAGVAVNDGNSPVRVTVKQACSMFTSTKKNYLIVNSALGGGTTAMVEGVFALPLQGTKNADGSAVDVEKIGTLSKVTAKIATFDGGPTAFNEMPLASHAATKVGAFNPSQISSIFVAGDTVYTCMDSQVKNSEAGVFASTALFDETGSIRAWTPPNRVSGAVQSVLGGGFDINTGNLYTLTNDDENKRTGDYKTVRINQWGKSGTTVADPDKNLSTLLATIFPAEQGGVTSFHVFDQFTKGFRTNSMAMAVAVGTTKVALIQIGKTVGGQFEVTKQFIQTPGATQNVFVYDAVTNPVLASIAPLTCAEVSRMGGDDEGWLFVGGYNGVAVLRNTVIATLDTNANLVTSPIGRGWPSSAALGNQLKELRNADHPAPADQNRFPGGTNWSFVKLVPDAGADAFNQTLKMIAWNSKLYVVTLTAVYHFVMAANKFEAPPGVALAEENHDALPVGTLVADMIVVSPDAVVGNNRGIIATSNGLYATNFAAKAAILQNDVFGKFALSLSSVGDSRQISKTANISVLGVDFDLNNDKVFGFDLPSSDAAVAIAELLGNPAKTISTVELNDTRQSIKDDGSAVYATLPKNYENTNFVTMYPRGTTDQISLAPLIDVDNNKNSLVGGVVSDTSSGMTVVPGDWGVRVNE